MPTLKQRLDELEARRKAAELSAAAVMSDKRCTKEEAEAAYARWISAASV